MNVSLSPGKQYDPSQALASLPDGCSAFLRTALSAALEARAVVLQHLAGDLQVEFKSDASPVTIADKATEQVIRQRLSSDFPEHSIYGEEYGHSENNADSDYLWLIDPIDGTKNFIRQLPFYSIQIALMHRGKIILGVSCAPALNELAFAEVGQGAWLNGQRLQVSQTQHLGQCYFSTGNLKWPPGSPQWQAVSQLYNQVQLARGYGDYFTYHRLANAQLDAVLEQGVNILDIAALAIIVREAGGIFTDNQGQELSLQTQSVLATATPELHQTIMNVLHHA